MRWCIKELIVIKKINTPKNFNAGKKITQTSGATSEHKHSEIKRFWTLNKRIITQNSKDSVIVNKFSDVH